MSPAFRSTGAVAIQSLEPRILLWSFNFFGWKYDSNWFKGWNSGGGGEGISLPALPPPETSLAVNPPPRQAAFDRLGNAFIAGVFAGAGNEIDFEPGVGVTDIQPYAGPIYLARYTSRGKLSWVHQIGGANRNVTLSAFERDTDGNLYLSGTFDGSVDTPPDFDPSDGVYSLHGTPYADYFGYPLERASYIAKYTPAGDLIWAQPLDGTVNGLAVDSKGNILLTGEFSGTADLAPGDSVHKLVARGSSDIFVSKLAKDGQLIWAAQFGGDSVDITNRDAGMDIVTDSAGNAYITGLFAGSADFDPSRKVANRTSAGREDAFMVCLSRDAKLKWASQSGGEFDDAGFRITKSPTGELFAAGITSLDVSNAAQSTFVTRIAASTGKAEWTLPFTGAILGDLFVASDASVYTTGHFSTADFDPGPGVHTLATTSVTGPTGIVGGGFVSHLSKKGIYLGVAQFGTDNEQTRGCAVSQDAYGHINLVAVMPPAWDDWGTTLPPETLTRRLTSSEFDTDALLNLLQIDSAASLETTP